MSFKIERVRKRVRLKHHGSWPTTITDAEAEAVTKWATERDCGIRIAYDIWRLNSNACVTMFILHWGT